MAVAAAAQPSGIIVNEFSNGDSGSREYAELLVVGPPCSTVDLRGWIVDDNNGDFGAGSGNGIANGHIRFTNTSNWAAVPVGALIVLYNEGSPNTSITQPDDPTDANNDLVYIVPSDDSNLEGCTDEPSVASNTYNCPSGFGAAVWSQIGLRNAGDAVQTREPSGAYFHGLSYGNLNGGPDNLHIAGPGGQTHFFFFDGPYNDINNFGSADVSGGGESPGAANNAANTAYIAALQAGASQQNILGSDTTLCSSAGLLLDAGSGFTTYLWSDGTMAQTLTTSGSGTYWVQVTIGGNCSVSDTIEVIESPAPSVTLPADTNFCSGDSLEIVATSMANNYLWNTGAISSSIFVSQSGTYSVTVTSGIGCTDSDTIVIGTGTAIPPNLGNDTVLCEAYNALLSPGTYASYSWSTGANTSTVTVVSDGIYSVTVVDASGCTDTDSIEFDLVPNPVADLGEDTALCPGATMVLNAGSTFGNYTWSTGQLGNPVTIFGPQTVWVRVEVGPCVATDTLFISPEVGSVPIDIPDTSACLGTTVLLDPGVSGEGVTWLWSNGATTSTLAAHAGATYSVLITGMCGTVSDSINVEGLNCNAEDSLFIPNIVTLNNDGFNDVWRVEANAVASIEMKIFNRWGRLVWEAADLSESWDGTDNGNTLQDGTYFYVVTLTSLLGTEVRRHGAVTLLH